MFGVLRRLLGEFFFGLWTCARSGLNLEADVGQIWYHSMTSNDGDGLCGPGRGEFPVCITVPRQFFTTRNHPIQRVKGISRMHERIIS